MEKTELIRYLKGTCRSAGDLAEHFKLSETETGSELSEYLDAGIVVSTLKGYMLTEDCKIFLGTIVLRKDNFAYVQPIGTEANDKKNDVRVAGKSLEGYIIGDKVYYQVDNWHNGTIVGLYKRSEFMSGTVFRKPSGGFFVNVAKTANSGIEVEVKDDLAAQGIVDGDLIKVKIVSSAKDIITASFVGLLAKASDVGADISAIIAANDAPMAFPPDVMIQARMIPQELSPKDLEGREDYRNETIVTIDGEDALDFDDAVSIRKIVNGYRIGVYIADVSYYVRPNTPLDNEASRRGTSIYVADRVVPMLPTELSNGICSLNPHVDRLVLSVIMDVDESGNVYHSSFAPGVINSKGRLTYNQVNDLFSSSKDEGLSSQIIQMLYLMREATSKIRKRRERHGAIDFESTELKFRLDEKGNPVEVIKREQGEGEKLIEDLMIIANVAVAEYLSKKSIPTLFRVHDNPPAEKLELFKQFLRNMKMIQDFPLTISSATLSHWYNSITDPETKFVISGFLLRSLAKAKYSPDNSGHFGLAEEYYLHFTSPIRRYPDLIVHRTLRDYVFNKEPFDYDHRHTYLANLAVSTSASERRAVDIERAVDDLEAAKYMSSRIGEEHDGIVTSIIAKGLFLEIENGIEVFVPIWNIDPSQKYIFSERHMDIQSTERDADDNLDFIRLGSKMKLYVESVDLNTRTIVAMSEKTKQYKEDYASYDEKAAEESYSLSNRPDYSRFRRRDSDRRPSFRRGGYRESENDRGARFSRGDRDSRRPRSRYDDSKSGSRDTGYSYSGRTASADYERRPANDNAALTRFVVNNESEDVREAKRRFYNTRKPGFRNDRRPSGYGSSRYSRSGGYNRDSDSRGSYGYRSDRPDNGRFDRRDTHYSDDRADSRFDRRGNGNDRRPYSGVSRRPDSRRRDSGYESKRREGKKD